MMLSMKALSGSTLSENFSDLTRKIFAAGCDIVFHCNGNLEKMFAIAQITPFLKDKALERADSACSRVLHSDRSDEIALRGEFSNLLTFYLKRFVIFDLSVFVGMR
nr:hypothetical protein [Bartonella quintana]